MTLGLGVSETDEPTKVLSGTIPRGSTAIIVVTSNDGTAELLGATEVLS